MTFFVKGSLRKGFGSLKDGEVDVVRGVRRALEPIDLLS